MIGTRRQDNDNWIVPNKRASIFTPEIENRELGENDNSKQKSTMGHLVTIPQGYIRIKLGQIFCLEFLNFDCRFGFIAKMYKCKLIPF